MALQRATIRLILSLVVSACATAPVTTGDRPTERYSGPILDMHLHASRADFAGPPPLRYCAEVASRPAPLAGKSWLETMLVAPCERELLSGMTDDEVMQGTLAVMERRGVIGVTSGGRLEAWRQAAPNRIIPSLIFGDGAAVSVEEARAAFQSGKYKVFGEWLAQYDGLAADDPSLAPYWALAAELDVPVGIHLGPGPPGAPYLAWPNYRARLYSPLALEEILVRHPSLRVYIMHAAWPMLDELLALLWAHPQVHLDISGIINDLPRPAFYRYLQAITDAGFAKRVLFGSDSMVWPGLLDRSIDTVLDAPFLSYEQKRDILYENAARFLRLSPEQIARHRAMADARPKR